MLSNGLTFIIGGARSGKSRRAQMLAERHTGKLVYLATAQALDAEMTERIAHHRADRDDRWQTVECPFDLPAALVREARSAHLLLVDCLTLWVSNLLLSGADAEDTSAQLIAALQSVTCPVIVVSNEVGMGIVPDNTLARQFRDWTGRLNQHVAAIATHVEFVVAGLSIPLKQGDQPIV